MISQSVIRSKNYYIDIITFIKHNDTYLYKSNRTQVARFFSRYAINDRTMSIKTKCKSDYKLKVSGTRSSRRLSHTRLRGGVVPFENSTRVVFLAVRRSDERAREEDAR